MTTELEEQFFKVFGIKPYCVRGCAAYYLEQGIDAWEKFNCEDTDCDKCEHNKSTWEYPEITDRMLLEMITSLANALCNYFVPCVDYYNLKSRVLYDCIQNKGNEELQYNIRQLFKEGE